MTSSTIPDPPAWCHEESLTRPRVRCGRPQGHEGAHVAETSNGARVWGIDYEKGGAP